LRRGGRLAVLAYLELPQAQLEEIAAIGDYWDKRVATEREFRRKLSFPR
jgi:hypothetical protein